MSLQRWGKLCKTILICKTHKDESLSLALSNNICKNVCKMPSVVFFPFTDKINGQNISQVCVSSP